MSVPRSRTSGRSLGTFFRRFVPRRSRDEVCGVCGRPACLVTTLEDESLWHACSLNHLFDPFEPLPVTPPGSVPSTDSRADDAEREAIAQAIGEASMCWEHVDRAGVFDSTRAIGVVDRLVEALARLREARS